MLAQNIQKNVTTEDIWTILDSVESDYKNDLADVMEGLDCEFEDNKDKHEDQDEEDNSLDSSNPPVLLENRKSFRFNKLCSQCNDKGET